MTLPTLTPDEREAARCLIEAKCEFFDDFDFHPRLGVEPAQMRALLAD